MTVTLDSRHRVQTGKQSPTTHNVGDTDKGDILGHDFMGEVVEVGRSVQNLKVGDRVVVPFTIACGNCFFCNRKYWSLCDNSNPNAPIPETLYGSITASGLFGYSHMFGGYAGGQADRPTALRQAIVACRKGGTVSIPGVYGGFIDKFPIGAAFSKGLTFKMGQTNVHNYLQPLLERIERGEIDPSCIITHRMSLNEAPRGYEIFKQKREDCMKVVLKP